MTQIAIPFAPHSPAKRTGGMRAWLAGAARLLQREVGRRRAHAQLCRLDDRMLKDIGLYRTDLVALGSRHGSRR